MPGTVKSTSCLAKTPQGHSVDAKLLCRFGKTSCSLDEVLHFLMQINVFLKFGHDYTLGYHFMVTVPC